MATSHEEEWRVFYDAKDVADRDAIKQQLIDIEEQERAEESDNQSVDGSDAGSLVSTLTSSIAGRSVMSSSLRSVASTIIQPKKRMRTASYSVLGVQIDSATLAHYVTTQLHYARRDCHIHLRERMLPLDSLKTLRIGAFRQNEACSLSCQTQTLEIRVYQVMVDDPEMLKAIRGAEHMFLDSNAIQPIARYGGLLANNPDQIAVHVCSQFCPFVLAEHYADLFGEDDADRVWISNQWHRIPVQIPNLPTTISFCDDHARFHVCAEMCEHMVHSGRGKKICAISRRVVNDEMSNEFGDGVGTSAQQEKTAENKGYLDETDGERRRRRSVVARSKAFLAATHVVNGVRVARTPGTRATSSARRTAKSRRTTSNAQQEPIIVVLTAEEMLSCGATVQDNDMTATTTMRFIPQIPFSEREPGKHNRQLALDRLWNISHRVERRKTFQFSGKIQTELIANEYLFSLCCEEACAVFYQLFMGAERTALEAVRYRKAVGKAEKAVEQHVAQRTKERLPIVASTCEEIYEATLSANSRRFPPIEMSGEFYKVIEAYYAIRCVLFFFQLLALPVRERGMLSGDTEEAIRTAFSFRHYAVVIYDLMRIGFTVGNIVVLDRDDFIPHMYYPDSIVLKSIGDPEKACTLIKGLISTLLRTARDTRNGVSMRYVQDTTLPWETLVAESERPGGARRVALGVINKRAKQLYDIGYVRPPSPVREIDDRYG